MQRFKDFKQKSLNFVEAYHKGGLHPKIVQLIYDIE